MQVVLSIWCKVLGTTNARGPILCKRFCHLVQEYLSCKSICHARGSVIWCKRICLSAARVSVSRKGFCLQISCTSNGLSLEILCKSICHARGSVSNPCKVPTHDSCKSICLMQGVLSHARGSVYARVSVMQEVPSYARVSVMQGVLSSGARGSVI